jgi:hypothetical protein
VARSQHSGDTATRSPPSPAASSPSSATIHDVLVTFEEQQYHDAHASRLHVCGRHYRFIVKIEEAAVGLSA